MQWKSVRTYCFKSSLAFAMLVLTGCSTAPNDSDNKNETSNNEQKIEQQQKPSNASGEAPKGNSAIPPQLVAWFKEGVDLMRQEKWQAARSRFEQVIDQEPNLSGPWVNLGIAFLQDEEPSRAVSAWEKAITINPKNVEAYLHLAYFYRKAGKFKKAGELYENALATNPDHLELNLNAGILYDLYLHEPEKALRHYRKYAELLQSEDKTVAGWIVDLERKIK